MPQDQNAFIYLRISEDRSGAGLGVDRQLADCERLAHEQGLTVLEIFTDNDVSAYSGKPRLQYDEMIRRLHEVEYVIAWHTDRLHRRPKELEDYADRTIALGVSTLAVRGGKLDLATPEGKMHARIYAAIAGYESEHKADRTRSKVRQTILEGRHPGGARPFGWDINRTEDDKAKKLGGLYEINEREASALRVAVDEVLEGRSMNSIMTEWNDAEREGGPLRTTQGNLWHASGFKRMLLRPRNAGLVTLEDEVQANVRIPAILSHERWRRLCDYLDGRAPQGHGNKAVTLGAGVIYCSCGLRVKTWYAGIGRKVDPVTGRTVTAPTYRCIAPKGTGTHPTKRVKPVDDAVRIAVWQWFGNPWKFQVGVHSPAELNQVQELESKRKDLEYKRSELSDDYVRKGLSLGLMAETEKRIVGRLAEIDDELAELRSRVSISDSIVMRAAEQARLQERLYREWSGLSLDDQRAMVRRTFHISLTPTPRTAPRTFDPNTVEIRLLAPDGTLPETLPEPVGEEAEWDPAAGFVPGQRIGPWFPDETEIRDRNRLFNDELERLANLVE